MNYVPEILKEQSRHLQQLIDEGKSLQDKLRDVEVQTEAVVVESLTFEYYAWHQSVLNTFIPLLREKDQEDILEDIKIRPPTSKNVQMIRGKMHGMLRDISRGRLNNLVSLIQRAEREALLAQAAELLVDNEDEVGSYILAAMLTATILENSVRNLCEREGIIAENGKWRPLAYLIRDLESQNILSKRQAKKLSKWKNIRNYVSHGQFDRFTRNDVEKMIDGVRSFIKDHL